MKKCFVFLLVLCVYTVLKQDVVVASSGGNYGSHGGGASKLNLGIWLPPMTLKLPKFNLPKIKISATIKPRKNQPPLKIHLPEVSVNAKALSDEDSLYGGSNGGYGGYGNGGSSSGGNYDGNGGYGNGGYGNGNSYEGNSYGGASYGTGSGGPLYEGNSYSSSNNGYSSNSGNYALASNQGAYQPSSNNYKEEKVVSSNDYAQNQNDQPQKQYANSPYKQYAGFNDNQNAYYSETNKNNYGLNNAASDSVLLSNENNHFYPQVDQATKNVHKQASAYGYAVNK